MNYGYSIRSRTKEEKASETFYNKKKGLVAYIKAAVIHCPSAAAVAAASTKVNVVVEDLLTLVLAIVAAVQVIVPLLALAAVDDPKDLGRMQCLALVVAPDKTAYSMKTARAVEATG